MAHHRKARALAWVDRRGSNRQRRGRRPDGNDESACRQAKGEGGQVEREASSPLCH